MRARADALLRNGSARHVDRHLPRPRASPAAPALAGREAARRLPGARQRRPAAPGQARGAAAGARRGALPAAADRMVDQRAEGRRPARRSTCSPAPTRGRDVDAQRLRAVPGALRPRRAWSISPNCCCARTNCCATTPALLAHYRHRFGELLVDEFQDTNAIQYGFVRLLARRQRATCSWSATTTRRSTAGAAPRSRTCSDSCAIIPARARPSSWNRTTAPAPTSSTPPTR